MMATLPDGLRLAGAFLAAGGVTALATRPARTLAVRTDFYDLPAGYKRHVQPTPYLGGAAVMAGFLIAALIFGGDWSRFVSILAGALLLFAVGTLDDRVGLGIVPRLAAQLAASLALWLSGNGWDVGVPTADLALTLIWMVGVTNAFNLMDNLDGATGTVGLMSALGVGILATSNGDPVLGAIAFTLAGACGGFLPSNLASPSRIFLGDGGSLPIGFLVAALAMECSPDSRGLSAFLAVVPLAGLPIFDTVLVVLSRWRRGATILSGARDHMTHRLYARLQSARRVAVVLGLIQAMLCALALTLHTLDSYAIREAAVGYVIVSLIGLVLLEGPAGVRFGLPAREPPGAGAQSSPARQ